MHQQSTADTSNGRQVMYKGALRAAEALCAAIVDMMLAKTQMKVLSVADVSRRHSPP